jgi:hypothetical protein
MLGRYGSADRQLGTERAAVIRSFGGLRLWIAAALSLALFGLSAWSWQSGHHWLGAFLVAVGGAFPMAQLLARFFHGRARLFGLPSVAFQPAILVVLVLALGVCEIAGIGFRQDVGRGVLALFGAAAGGYGVLLLSRAFSSRD